MKYLIIIILILTLWLLASTAFSGRIDQQRIDFLMAEKLIGEGNDEAFFAISKGLTDYPLYPYLQYQWLQSHLEQSDKILDFLQQYKNTRYAGLLRKQWLNYFIANQHWHEFIRNYQADGSMASECQLYWAQLNSGFKEQALKVALRLWSVDVLQPKECEPLFASLAMSSLLTPELIWKRFELALNADNVSLAVDLRKLLDANGQNLADLWLKVHEKPSTIQEAGFWNGDSRHLARIFEHGIEKMAKSDLDAAVIFWDTHKQNSVFDSRLVQQMERRLALALAHNRKPGAYERLNKLIGYDKDIREWKVRSALFEQSWQHISDALAGLTLEELNEPIWQYWLARSLLEKGDLVNARAAFAKLAEDRSYYGFLAADAVGKPYSLKDEPVDLSENELAKLASETEFQAVKELNYFDRPHEAERQWWFTVGKMGKQQKMWAAKLAQLWQWDQVAIKTMVKADYWDDLSLRFPVIYFKKVTDNAYRQNLDPALVFGIIRQESMLDRHAQSAAGAIGLMQIMPGTGRQLAMQMNDRWQSPQSLFDPEVNIKYGAYYYKRLLNRFNGHVAVATAAYNAGPGRVARWLPSGRSVPADIWVETIPYKETRKYVTSILSYTIIYQHRMRSHGLKMKDFMQDVLPG